MLYLNENIKAKKEHFKLVFCWLSIKLRGRHSNNNTLGHRCNEANCKICSKDIRRKTINNHFKTVLQENNNLKTLILGKPNEIYHLNKIIFKRLIVDFGLSEDEVYEQAKSLFVNSGYKNWFVKYGHNHNLAETLNRSTCTYCNRQYITSLKSDTNEKIMVPQFDHWFTKSKFPLLALSFHNLIPSCSICNSSVKSTETLRISTHTHPYIDDIGSLFSFSYKKKTFIRNNVSIKGESLLDKRVKRTLNAFRTKNIYNSHSSTELRDLLDMKYKYTENYLDILFNKTFKGDISEPDKYRLIFGTEFDEKDFYKRPFSKFKKDILRELKIIAP